VRRRLRLRAAKDRPEAEQRRGAAPGIGEARDKQSFPAIPRQYEAEKIREKIKHSLDTRPEGLYFAAHNSLPFVLKRLVSGLHQTLVEVLKQRNSTTTK
jgi:hypothetical protein